MAALGTVLQKAQSFIGRIQSGNLPSHPSMRSREFKAEAIPLLTPQAIHKLYEDVDAQMKTGGIDESGIRSITHHILPNEDFPFEAKEAFNQCPENQALISVGTDRGLSTPYKPSSIIQADFQKAVVFYNNFNIEMVRACKTRADYLKLRRAKTAEDFKAALADIKYKPDDRHIDISDSKYMNLYLELKSGCSYDNPSDEQFERYAAEGDLPSRNMRSGYINSYLYNDDEFGRIKQLADHDKIVTRHCNLASSEDMTELSKEVKSTNQKIGALDLSNAWWSGYIPDKSGLECLKPASHDQCQIIATDAAHSGRGSWDYAAVSLEEVGTTVDEQRKMGKTAEEIFRSEIFATGEKALFSFLDDTWLGDGFRGGGTPSCYERLETFIVQMEKEQSWETIKFRGKATCCRRCICKMDEICWQYRA